MNTQQRSHKHLYAEELLKYFITEDDVLNTLIQCNPQQIPLVTTDKDLYEALGSIQSYDSFPLNKLTKLLETVHIQHQHKQVLTHERAEELRKKVLR